MIILGLNGYMNSDHDAGAALVVDGILAAAVEEERLVRRKRAIRTSPTNAAKEVLAIAGVDASAVDAIAYPWSPRLLEANADEESMRIKHDLLKNDIDIRADIPVHWVKHHEAHAWSGLYYMNPCAREGTEILVLDGAGEVSSGTQYSVMGGQLVETRSFSIESSLGCMYEAATRIAGFGWGQEGKLMGLASYGDPGLLPTAPITQISSKLAQPRHDGMQSRVTDTIYDRCVAEWARCFYSIWGDIPRCFIERARFASIIQRAFELRVLELVRETRSKTVIIAGGSALNCSNNGKIAVELASQERQLVVPPCANDAGTALGAGLAIASQTDTISQTTTAHHGRDIESEDIERVAEHYGFHIRRTNSKGIAERVGSGQIIGWLHGRAEVGPRALGGRSIIANTSSTFVRDRVNVLKGRETWRPLAPSVTESEFCKSFAGVANHFMLEAAQVKSPAPALEGVTHVDGSARPHVVGEWQKVYKDLIETIGRANGGTEAILCTSFNVAGKPMVYRLAESIRSAEQMQLDAIVGNGWEIDLKRKSK